MGNKKVFKPKKGPANLWSYKDIAIPNQGKVYLEIPSFTINYSSRSFCESALYQDTCGVKQVVSNLIVIDLFRQVFENSSNEIN